MSKQRCPFCAGEIESGAQECPVCQHSLINSNPAGMLPVGTVLAERYTLGEFAGADGEGVFYRAVENSAGVKVTVKEYLPVTLAADRDEAGALRAKAGSEVLFKTTRMDFADLYRAIMRVTPAPGLEAVLDVLEQNNTVYAVMEDPGGIPLEQYLTNLGRTLSPAEARSMLRPVFEGVAALHTAGLVHRGVSPENVRVLETGKARLAGYATIDLRTMGGALRPQLYEGYSAPEQYSTAEFEGRYTDEYGLAAVFYRLVCGQAPVPAGQRLVSDSNPTARMVNATVPAYLSKVLERGLQLKPADRIQTVTQLQDALESAEAAKRLLEVRPAEKPGPKKPGFSVNQLLAGVMVLLAIVVLLLLWGAVRQGGEPASSAPQPTPTAAPTPEPERLPDFRGLSYSQVLANDSYSSKFLFFIKEEYNDEKPAGTIIAQTPEANSLLVDEATTVELIVSKGPAMISMPKILGFSQDGAIRELEAVGLKPSVYLIQNDGTYASGCVVKCSAAPGEKVNVGSTVIVYIAADRDVINPATPVPEELPEPTAIPAG